MWAAAVEATGTAKAKAADFGSNLNKTCKINELKIRFKIYQMMDII